MLNEFFFADDMANSVQQKRKCKKVWIKYPIHVTAMMSQSVSKRLRWYISQRLESLTRSTLSRVVHIGDRVNARIAKASAAFGRLRGNTIVFGIEVESDLIQS